MSKIFVVHRHEDFEGSTILAVTKDRNIANEIVGKETSKENFMGCDQCSIEELELEEDKK